VRGGTSEKKGANRRNTISKSRACKSNKLRKYCRKPGHLVAECYKPNNSKEKQENNNQPAEASIIDSRLHDDVLLITIMDNEVLLSGFLIQVVPTIVSQ